ncbi:uncharacterized protein LOC131070228 isoform X2 [Cryptomeria japonica]|uniref:uncharacterized protein LOC131070228 isoform X2 n=1 Tax=Cryptomeria japonica TaxID=3369 RepID=UPI0025AC73F4|nr:uncharacterized protein LOC131070228 isoform X2 [Cryptomeria japonica]
MEITMNGEEGEKGDAMSRIFIGGLGASVTGDELERIFSSFGRIHGLDIIRTNNRSFAYVNLQPADEKSLSKLFSLYNGCAWKGGRLRLEKAKEHYLVRLRREWATDAAQMVTDFVDANTSVKVQEETSTASEKNGLKIFFPRQKKVKVLPGKGTGKHKYSFQRVESVPVTQLLFCGCEEQKIHIERDENNEIDVDMNNAMPETRGVTEKELNIMKRVMDKLIGNEEQMQSSTELGSRTEIGHAHIPAKWTKGKARIGMERFDDEGNIERVGDGETAFKSSDTLAASIKTKESSTEKELENIEDSEDEKSLPGGMTENMASENAYKPPSTKVKFRMAKLGQKDSKQEIHSQVNNMKSSPKEGNNRQPGVLELKESKRLKFEDGACSSIQQNEARDNLSIDVGLEINGNTFSKDHGNDTVTEVQDGSRSRVQKASWKELVGETGRVSFSLSSIIGGAGSPYLVKDRESQTLEGLENSSNHSRKEISRNLPDRNRKHVMEKGHKSSSDYSHSFLSGLVVKPKDSESQKSEPIAEMKNEDDTIKGEEVPKVNFTEMEVEDKNCHDQVDKDLNLSGQETGSPALCMFMRSENAEAEWLKSKAAVQRYTKFRKKIAPKSTKR